MHVADGHLTARTNLVSQSATAAALSGRCHGLSCPVTSRHDSDEITLPHTRPYHAIAIGYYSCLSVEAEINATNRNDTACHAGPLH